MSTMNRMEKRNDNSPEHEPRVSDLMEKQVLTIYETDTLDLAMELMKWKKVRHLPVLDQNEMIVGILSERDCLKVSISRLKNIDIKKLKKFNRKILVQDVMAKDVVTCGPEAVLSLASDLIFSNRIGCLPVVQNKKVVGIITKADFVKSFHEWNVSFKG